MHGEAGEVLHNYFEYDGAKLDKYDSEHLEGRAEGDDIRTLREDRQWDIMDEKKQTSSVWGERL